MLEIGISTACYHGRLNTEDAFAFLAKQGFQVFEMNLQSFSEYTDVFGDLLLKIKDETGARIHSIHTLNSQFETQLFRGSERQIEDAVDIFRSALRVGQRIGAQVYVMHGIANIKHRNAQPDYLQIAQRYKILSALTEEHGMKLAFENVHWCSYSRPGFLDGLSAALGYQPYCTLDTKQAKQSGAHYSDYLGEMAETLVNVHVCDYTESGELRMPGQGTVNFADLFGRLSALRYTGPVMLEVYSHQFEGVEDLLEVKKYLEHTQMCGAPQRVL